MTKLDEFMTKNGKPLKQKKEPKDGKKITVKERNELIDKMLKDFGYTI